MKVNPQRQHKKYSAIVEHTSQNEWSARVQIDGRVLIFDNMQMPLPLNRPPGSVFTIHKTKRGETYLFWPPPRKVSRAKLKNATKWAKETRKRLGVC